MESKGESEHFLEILEHVEILDILEIPRVKKDPVRNDPFVRCQPVEDVADICWRLCLVSHCSAIGDTVSCDGPCSSIDFRGKLVLRYPSKACLWIAMGHFYGKKWGVAAIVCDTTENTVRLGYCYTCLAIGGLSVNSPALILSKKSGIFLAKIT